jgi:hypothetical protein
MRHPCGLVESSDPLPKDRPSQSSWAGTKPPTQDEAEPNPKIIGRDLAFRQSPDRTISPPLISPCEKQMQNVRALMAYEDVYHPHGNVVRMGILYLYIIIQKMFHCLCKII